MVDEQPREIRLRGERAPGSPEAQAAAARTDSASAPTSTTGPGPETAKLDQREGLAPDHKGWAFGNPELLRASVRDAELLGLQSICWFVGDER